MTAAIQKLSAEDRLDIQELFAKYAWGIDLADPELVVQCFTDDAYYDHLWQGRVQGHEAILKNLHALWYDRQSWWFGRQHLFNHFLITPEATPSGEPGARVKTFFQIMQYNVDYNTNFVFGIGTRNDLVIKRKGVWLFQHLLVNAWTSRDQIPWKGEITMKAKPVAPPAPPAPPEFEKRS
jgi:hypothetical protein